MSSKHTPRPWDVNFSGDSYHIVDGDGRDVAEVFQQSNAHLLTAAPELLESLEWIYLQFFTEGKPDAKKVARTPAVKLYEIKRLIAKAKGA